MAFTNWADLRSKMLDGLASGAWRISSCQVGDRETRYWSFAGFKAALEYVEKRAAQETGTGIRRNYAAHGEFR